jgi:hypothetical protein
MMTANPTHTRTGPVASQAVIAGTQPQDTVLARQAARDLGIGAHLSGDNAFTYGLLYDREQRRSERLQAEADQVWKRASRRRDRRWMR